MPTAPLRAPLRSGSRAGTARARRLDPDARRAQLVEVGMDLLTTRPFDQLSVDEIARSAGVSKALVFHYFPAKSELQAAVLRAAADELVTRLLGRPELPLEAQLHAGVEAFVDFIRERTLTYVSLVRSAGSDPLLQTVFDETRAAIVSRVAAALGIDDPPPAMRVAIRSWLALVDEATLDWLVDTPFPQDELVRYLERAALAIMPVALELVVRVDEERGAR